MSWTSMRSCLLVGLSVGFLFMVAGWSFAIAIGLKDVPWPTRNVSLEEFWEEALKSPPDRFDWSPVRGFATSVLAGIIGSGALALGIGLIVRSWRRSDWPHVVTEDPSPFALRRALVICATVLPSGLSGATRMAKMISQSAT